MNRRVVGLVALLAGAPVAVIATFLPLYEQVWRFTPDDAMTLSHTSWLVRTSNGGVFGREALYGVPVVVAAALVVVGAVFARAVWGRLVAFGGAMLLVGAAWAVAQYALATSSAGQPAGEGLTIDTEFGSAVPVYGVACVLTVVGGLLVQDWPARAVVEGPAVYRVDEDQAGADDLTPPFGIALPGVGSPPAPGSGLPPAPDAIVPPGYDTAGGDGGGGMRRGDGGER